LGALLKKIFFYRFRLFKSRGIYEVKTKDSDEALKICLKETRWPITRIIYDGKREALEPEKN
jgi:hypothetical protein